MIVAPLVAIADTNPRSIKSTITGPRPVLTTCAPIPQRMPAPARFAPPIARTTALKSAAARMSGSESTKVAIVSPRADGLERPRRRRADCNDAAPRAPRARDRAGRRVADRVALRLETVILDTLDADRLKRAIADVQGDLGERDAARLQRGNQRLAEVQACGRRGDRSTVVREQRLIAIMVIRPIVALDVRRQRHVTDG